MISLLRKRQQRAVKQLVMQMTGWQLTNLWRASRHGARMFLNLGRQSLAWSKTTVLNDTLKRRVDNRLGTPL
jgi:hypothetical protein